MVLPNIFDMITFSDFFFFFPEFSLFAFVCALWNESAHPRLTLQAFQKFEDTDRALKAATAICDNKLDKTLRKFLKSTLVDQKVKTKLAVVDSKLGGLISNKLGLKVVASNAIQELTRGIRTQIHSLLTDISEADSHAMRLGLSHSLSRYKIQFSPDKVDTMIVQAISLLDELDKELNTYCMRAREWYGWHFPEMSRIIADHVMYAKTVKRMQVRRNAKNTDFSDILPEDVEQALKEAAEVSMGTEIAIEDVDNIGKLCDQIIEISTYRATLWEYLTNRMEAIAPNLTVMVGELVGARLIAHAGSLTSLAKAPASTVQILGAEKALFRAIKNKGRTPKYGLIYHASLVGQAAPKNKGKISRMLAAKTALSIRIDAYGEDEDSTMGVENRRKVEARLQALEGGQAKNLSGSGKVHSTQAKHTPSANGSYNAAADVKMDVDSDDDEESEEEEEKESKKKKSKKEKKEKKEKKKQSKKDKKRRHSDVDSEEEEEEEEEEPAKKKRKKESSEDPEEEEEEEKASKKKSKKDKKDKKKSKKKSKKE